MSRYVALLEQWQRAINLVAASTLRDPWRRHILDAGQLWRYLPPGPCRVVDLGSGAGLPGLVLAMMGSTETHLIEADGRKAAFLNEASRQLGLRTIVHARRAEAVTDLAGEVITARGLAPLSRLLPLATRFGTPDSLFLFLKGRNARRELDQAGEHWQMETLLHPSLSEPDACVIALRNPLRRCQS